MPPVADTVPNKVSGYFSIIRQALKGEAHDFTKGSLRRAIVLLAIPMILEMSMESVFALVDLFFTGKLGQHAVSTVGLTESVLTIVYSIAIGISVATTATVARRVGEGNKEGAAATATQAIIISLAMALLFSLAGIIWAPHLLRLMGAEDQTVREGVIFTRIMTGSSPALFFLFVINGIFRGAGNAAIAMKTLVLANVLNIILCPLLINGLGPVPPMGLTGAALATTIGRSIGVGYQLWHLFNGRHIVKLHLATFSVQWELLKSLLHTTWPAAIQFIITSCSWIFLARLVAETGHSAASAGYQTAIRILMFFLLPAWGISNAAATLVGQNLGAGSTDRAEAAVLQTAKYNTFFMLSVTLLFFLLAAPLVSLFTDIAEVQAVGSRALRIISTGYIFYGVGMVLNNAFNGAGDTRTPTLLNICGFWLLQIPLAYVLAKLLDMGPTGVFIALPVSETAITIAAFILFKRGRWKKVKV